MKLLVAIMLVCVVGAPCAAHAAEQHEARIEFVSSSFGGKRVHVEPFATVAEAEAFARETVRSGFCRQDGEELECYPATQVLSAKVRNKARKLGPDGTPIKP